MSLHKKETGQLPISSTTVQALDNQWVPRDVLEKIEGAGKARRDHQTHINELSRYEFLRALINSRSVVVNRAYMLNSPVLREEVTSTEARPHLGELLSTQAIVPFLFGESSLGHAPAFTLEVAETLHALHEIERDFDVHCTRLSWDDAENARLIRQQLAARFHTFASDLYAADLDTLAAELKLGREAVPAFQKVLRRVRDAANRWHDARGEHITREELYRQFICQDAENAVAAGIYDTAADRFALPLKQVLDLRYALNLPDALRANALTAQDSLPRSALPFADDGRAVGPAAPDPQALAERMMELRGFEFVTGSIAKTDLRHLTVEDIVRIRARAEWGDYMNTLEDLLNDPYEFHRSDAGLERVIHAWKPLSRVIAEVQQERVGGRALHFVELAADALVVALGASGVGHILHVSVVGGKLTATVFRERLARLHARGARLLGSYILRTPATQGAAEVESEQQFIAAQVRHGREYFAQAIERFEREHGIHVNWVESAASARRAGDETSDVTLPDEG